MAQRVTNRNEVGLRRYRMTYGEYLAWADEDVRAEWVNGEVIAYMPPDKVHQDIAFFLATILRHYVELRGLGEIMIAPFEMRLDAVNSSREPDILFVSARHAERLTRLRLVGPADVVIEITSDSTAHIDIHEKFEEYRQAEVAEHWLVDPREGRQAFTAYHLTQRGTYEPLPLDAAGRFHSLEIPGFWLDPAWLWRQPLPQPLRMLARIAPDLLHNALVEESDTGTDRNGRH